MSLKKKHKYPCLFASSKKPSKRKKLSHLFDKNRADADEKEQSRWENETVSSSRSKIEDKGKDEPAEPNSQESWQQLSGRTIVAGNRLHENLLKSVSCRFCHVDVTLLKNVSARSGLGSSWIMSCQNERCPSRNSSENFFLTRTCYASSGIQILQSIFLSPLLN